MSQTDVKVTPQNDAGDAGGAADAPHPPPTRAPRLYALDALRVVAALSVLLFHFTGVDAATDANWGINPKALFPSIFPYTSYGSYGVQLFFIISGFVICLSAWDRSPGQFVRARFLRLFPAYWFSVVVALLVWRGLPDGERKPPSYSEALTNLTMVQTPLAARHLVGAYWTLWVELTFYLIFLVVLWKGLDYVRVSVFCWLWLLGSVLAQKDDVPLLGIFAQPLNTALFVSGIAMYLMYRFGPDLKLWGLLAASWLVMQSDLIQHADHVRDEQGMDRQPYVALALVTVFYLVVLAVALHKLDRIRWTWLTTAGALVYPLYLLHEELGWAMIRVLFGDGHLGAWATLALTTSVLIVLAYLVHRFVERPLQRWLRARLAAESRKPPVETGG
ncbi:acyltransferase family protein [Streptomyces sp. NPDC091281]|uniref:acyltransferase family protein n=1 Tax=Streptomyces sp. NPDC091281 TaxID=3365985 RepID=UPI003808D192